MDRRGGSRLRQRDRPRGGIRQEGIVDPGVEVERGDRAAADLDPDHPVVDKVAADIRLEPDEVARLGIGDIEIAGDRMDGDAEVDRPDAREGAGDGKGGCLDLGDVVIGHRIGER